MIQHTLEQLKEWKNGSTVEQSLNLLNQEGFDNFEQMIEMHKKQCELELMEGIRQSASVAENGLLSYKYDGEELLGIDISIVSSTATKTLLYYLIPVFEYYSKNKQNLKLLKSMLDSSVSGQEILELLSGKIDLLEQISFLKNQDEVYFIKDLHGLYNQGILLSRLKILDNSFRGISTEIHARARENNAEHGRIIEEMIMQIQFSIHDYFWNHERNRMYSVYHVDEKDYGWELSKQLKLYLRTMSLPEYGSMPEKEMTYRGVGCLYLAQELDARMNTLRLALAQMAYLNSPFVSESRKHDMNHLFGLLWNILRNAEITQVYIENNPTQPRKPVDLIGRADHTTRIHFVFALLNGDIYSLRIDMPHKDVPYIHINLQEVLGTGVGDAAMPIFDKDVIQEIRSLLGKDISKYFYNGQKDSLWFRIHFDDLIQKIKLETTRNYLSELYEKHKHFDLHFSENGYELFYDFKEFVQIYLSTQILSKQELQIYEECMRYRSILRIREWIIKYPSGEWNEKMGEYIRKWLPDFCKVYSNEELEQMDVDQLMLLVLQC